MPYTQRINDIKEYINKQRLRREIITDSYNKAVLSKQKNEENVRVFLSAREVINTLVQKTLDQISVNIGQLVTDAIHAVFENPYTFKIDFVTRRNQTECDLYVTRNNIDRHPLESNGGGLADIISSALRPTFLVLSESRLVLILDEPFKFLSEDLQSYCCIMLKTISTQLGIQIIMVSHLNEMKEVADSIINVSQVDGNSSITKIK